MDMAYSSLLNKHILSTYDEFGPMVGIELSRRLSPRFLALGAQLNGVSEADKHL